MHVIVKQIFDWFKIYFILVLVVTPSNKKTSDLFNRVS